MTKKTRFNLLFGISIALLVSILIIVNLSEDDPESAGNADVKQLVQDYSAGLIKDGNASITSHQLIITEDNGDQMTFDLPEDEFFVSIAPYVHVTHPCAIHSLTGCRGELVGQTFEVRIEEANGDLILDETMVSQPNGFLDLWLPRDRTYRVIVQYEGTKAETEISTFRNDHTCITTLQLT